MEVTITDRPEQERFEGRVDGVPVGFVYYRERPDGVALTHTEVLPAFEGRGVGSALARAAIEWVRDQGRMVIPICPFVTRFIRRHPEYVDLVVDRYRDEVTVAE